MDNTKLASKLMFLLKAGLFVTLISMSLNAFAHKKHHRHYYPTGYTYASDCCNPCSGCCYQRPLVYYSGPDCNGYYYGSDCSRIVWVPCHWDVYGNYIPGYWLSVNR